MGIGWVSFCARLNIYPVGLLVVVIGAVNEVGAGLEGVGVGDEVDTYYFTSKAGLPSDGRYVRLGEADGVLYLQSCVGNNSLVVVNTQDVGRLAPGQPSQDRQIPALLDILIRHLAPQIGDRPRC